MTVKENAQEMLVSDNFNKDVTEFFGNIEETEREFIADYIIAKLINLNNTLDAQVRNLTVPQMGSISELNVIKETMETIIRKNSEKIDFIEVQKKEM